MTDEDRLSGAAWSDKLKCYYRGLVVVREGWIRIMLPEGSCTDMSGAIKVAKGIMPNVCRIDTYSGNEPDTVYAKEDGRGWSAYRQPEKAVNVH